MLDKTFSVNPGGGPAEMANPDKAHHHGRSHPLLHGNQAARDVIGRLVPGPARGRGEGGGVNGPERRVPRACGRLRVLAGWTVAGSGVTSGLEAEIAAGPGRPHAEHRRRRRRPPTSQVATARGTPTWPGGPAVRSCPRPGHRTPRRASCRAARHAHANSGVPKCPVARRLPGQARHAGPADSPIAACYDNLSSTFDYLESR
jgi:hypothetical protein